MRTLQRALLRFANPHVKSIPDAVLHRLAEHFDLRSRLAFSQTCRYLRHRCLAMPSIWRNFDIRDSLLPLIHYQDWWLPCHRQPVAIECAEELLRRSEPFATQVSISLHADLHLPELGGPGDQAITDMLERLLGRCDRLAVEFMAPRHPMISIAAYTPPANECWSAASVALCAPAPMLRSLQLYRGTAEAMEWLARLPADFLAGQHAKLSSLYLRGIYLPLCTNPSLTGLVVLDYDVYPATMTASELLRTLADLPALEVLGLRVCDFIDDTCETSRSEGLPPRLHSVSLSLIPEDSDRYITDSANVFQERGIAKLAISRGAVPGDDLPGAWHAFPGAYARPEHLVLSLSTILSHNADSTRLLHLGCAAISTMCIHPAACAHLVSLTLPEHMWDVRAAGHAAFPPCARLERLCIVRGQCGVELPAPREAAGIFVALHDAPCEVPALRELHIVHARSPRCYWAGVPWRTRRGCLCDWDRVMLLEELGRFVRDGLRFDAPKLKTLSWACLDRVGDVYPEQALRSLWDVAEDVVPMGEVVPEGVLLYDRWTSANNAACIFGKTWEENAWEALCPRASLCAY